MHDIPLRESSSTSSQGLNAIDPILEHTEVENCPAILTEVLQKRTSWYLFNSIQNPSQPFHCLHTLIGR